MKEGTKFLAVHNLRVMKFVVEKVVEGDSFPFTIKALEEKVNNQWIPCDFTDDVAFKWFWARRIEVIND